MRQVASLPPRSRASTPPATACCAAALYLCPWSPLWTHPQPRPPRISAKTPRTRLSQQGGPHRRETLEDEVSALKAAAGARPTGEASGAPTGDASAVGDEAADDGTG